MNMLLKLQARYESYVSSTASPQTRDRYAKSLNAFFSYFPEKTDTREFSRSDIEDYKAYRRKAGVSATTVNYDVQIVRAFWNWMVDMEAATYNPASSVKRLKQQEPVRQSLTESSQIAVYGACLNANERLLVGLALSTGLRCKTLVELEKSEFDLERGMLVIPPEKMKAGRALELPLRADVIILVRELSEGRLWGNWALTTDALSRRFTLLMKRAGISLRGLRTARRTVATTLLRNGVDVRLVRDILGHKSISTTNKYATPATNAEISTAISNLPTGI